MHVVVYYHTGDGFPSHSAASEGNAQILGMLLTKGHCGVDDRDQHDATAAHKGTCSY